MSENPQGFSYYGKTPNGVEMALTLSLEGIDTPDEIATFCTQLDAALHAKKFTRSDRLDKPAGGWGGKGQQQAKPKMAPPAGIVQPPHCGEPMQYVKYHNDKTANAPGDEFRGLPAGWKDMWVCAKDKQCEDVTSGKSDRAAVNFDMKRTPAETAPHGSQGGPGVAETPRAAQPSATAPALSWTAFWREATPLGLKQSGLDELALTYGKTKATLTDEERRLILEELKQRKGVAA